MAGIGWRLERLIDRDSLGSTLGAFLTGIAVTSGPWLLTTAMLVIMRMSAVSAGVVGVDLVERVITAVYATVIVLSAPLDIVLSRYASDRVYESRRDQIAAPLRTIVAAALLGFAAIGAGVMALIQVPLALAAPGAFLAAVVAAQWLLLSAAGGLSSPGIILRAFALGAPISVIAATAMCRIEALGPLGYLYGFAAGQVVTLALLLWGTFRALPAEEDDQATVGAAFRDYWLLAVAALAFHAGLWIDKIVVYVIAGADVASMYAATAAVAWLSVVPACAYLFVTIETVFHRRFRAYYTALHTGASLSELERLASDLRHEVARTLRGTATVQICVTLVCLPAAPSLISGLNLAADATTMRWLLAGAGLQMVAVASTMLLYYFDLRREAFVSAATQVLTNLVLTVAIGANPDMMGIGYTAACALTCAVSIGLLARRMSGLLERTFQLQPYASEDYTSAA